VTTWQAILNALLAVLVGLPLVSLILLVGVPGLWLWADGSRERYCERRGWKGLSRWRT
jgi:hypothetical protein